MRSAVSPLPVYVFVGNEQTVAEAAMLFERAVLVIGPHGAGLTNALFCKPGA